MKFGAILGASMCLNVVLIAVSLSDRRRTATSETLAPVDSVTEVILNPGEFSPASSARTDPLPWKEIQSDDLATYVFNLRAAGFPERIAQRIVIAELDRVFAARRQATPPDTNYWRTGPQRDQAERARREARRALASERGAKLKELLGDHLREASLPTGSKSFWVMLYLTGVTGDTGTDKLERLSRVWPKVFGGVAGLESQSGLRTAESEIGGRQAHDQLMDEMRQILGPSGFQEFELRTMAMDVTDVWGSERLLGCIMTGAEFRELLRIKKETTLPFHEQFRLEIPEPSPELTRKIDERIRALLGEERFKGYQRAKDPQFRGIHRAFQNEETMGLTWAVYDIYAGLKESSSRIHEQASLTDTERQIALRTLRTETERSLERTMGPVKFASYVEKNRGNFGWLDELTVKDANQK